MSKLIRRKKEIGAALIVALQITTLTLISLMLAFASGPSAPSAPSAPPAGAIPAVKLYEPQATQIFNLATTRAQSAQQSSQQSSLMSETTTQATLTTNLADYPPYSYVYISGTGFEPGETVNMIVVELDPIQQAYQPWDVVADENGNIETTWYVFSDELIGATMQVTATGQTSNLTASATFTDNAAPVLYQDLARTIRRDAFAWGDTVYLKGNLNGQSPNRCYKVDWVDPFGSVVQSSNFEPGTLDTSAFAVPSSGPSGIWQVKLYEANNGNGPCNSATFSVTPSVTLTFDVARAVIIGALADNYVDLKNPTTNQNAAGTTLIVSKKSATDEQRTFLRFDLSGISGTINSSKLRMSISAEGNSALNRIHDLHRVTATWTDASITWNNAPAVAGSPTNS